MKYIPSYQEKHQTDVIDVALVFLLLTMDIFPTFFQSSIADFVQENNNWVSAFLHKNRTSKYMSKCWIKKTKLTHLVPVLPSYRNLSIDLHNKSIDWFLCEGNTGI